jgi:hypothetical protein
MRSLFNPILLLFCVSLASGSIAASKEDKSPADKKSADKAKPDKKKDSDKKKGADKSKDSKSNNQTDDGKGRLNLPLEEDHDSLGLKIPYYDASGRLQMNFVIGVARKVDPDHVHMKDMQVETFNEEGETDMLIDLPASELDLNTRVITSHTKTTIKRDDFVITGDSVVFNTITKVGSLAGNVHMTIFDLGAAAGPDSAPAKSE